jgi:hypothetical protein
MATVAADRHVPPYIPFETFTAFLARLKNTTVPNRIDNTMMPTTMSGTMRRQVVSALRFIGLVNDEGTVSDKLRKLVSAYDDEGKWKDEGMQIICDAYDTLVPNNFNLAAATPGELDEAFGSLSGQMKEKCIRFYLAAMTSVGLQISPHVLQRRKRTTARRRNNSVEKGIPATNNSRKQKARPSNGAVREIVREEKQQKMDTITFPIYFKNKPQGSLVVPAELAAADVKAVELLMPVLRAYAGEDKDME